MNLRGVLKAVFRVGATTDDPDLRREQLLTQERENRLKDLEQERELDTFGHSCDEDGRD